MTADVPGVQGIVRMTVPADDGPRFWTLDYDGEGTVHVHDRFVAGADIGRTDMPFNPWMRARCGLLRREQETVGLGVFADERLCVRCVRATPAADQPKLFEHPVA